MSENKILGKIKIREDGDITIPKKARDYLGINPGDKIGIELNNDGTISISKV